MSTGVVPICSFNPSFESQADLPSARFLHKLLELPGNLLMARLPCRTSWLFSQESIGDEGVALQAFLAMQSKGCKPDSIVYNAIIDALWDTGIVWAQQHAALLYRRASAAGVSLVPAPKTRLRMS